jgi:hypothetical protein
MSFIESISNYARDDNIAELEEYLDQFNTTTVDPQEYYKAMINVVLYDNIEIYKLILQDIKTRQDITDDNSYISKIFSIKSDRSEQNILSFIINNSPILIGSTIEFISSNIFDGRIVEFIINSRDKNGDTALHLLFFKNIRPDVISYFIRMFDDNNLDISIKNNKGETVFLVAAMYGTTDLLEEMIELYHSDDISDIINIPDNKGWTPLMTVAISGNIKIAEILLTFGADKESINNNGKNVLDILHTDSHLPHGQIEMLVEYISNYGLNERDDYDEENLRENPIYGYALDMNIDGLKLELGHILVYEDLDDFEGFFQNIENVKDIYTRKISEIGDPILSIKTYDKIIRDIQQENDASKLVSIYKEKINEDGDDLEKNIYQNFVTDLKHYNLEKVLDMYNKKEEDTKTSLTNLKEYNKFLREINNFPNIELNFRNKPMKLLMIIVDRLEYPVYFIEKLFDYSYITGEDGSATFILDLNAKGENGDTALIVAARHNNLNTVRILVEQGADIKSSNNDKETAFTATTDENIKKYLTEARKSQGMLTISEIIMENITTEEDDKFFDTHIWDGHEIFNNGIVEGDDYEEIKNNDFLNADPDNIIFLIQRSAENFQTYDSYAANIHTLIYNINQSLYLDCKRDDQGNYVTNLNNNLQTTEGVFPFYGSAPKPYSNVVLKLSTDVGQKYVFLKDFLTGLRYGIRVYLISELNPLYWKYTTSYDMHGGMGKDHCQDNSDKKIQQLLYCTTCPKKIII